jgi:Holliday junction DNA helicase RuvA
MIAHIKGMVTSIDGYRVVIDVGGVGYELRVPVSVAEDLRPQTETILLTYHHVREAAQELFGFDSQGAKDLFELLIGVSSVGPKSALAIMSLGTHEEIRAAIASENVGYIAQATGVGKKSAERISVELKDKVGVMAGNYVGEPTNEDEAFAALLALGYNKAQAAQALAKVSGDLAVEDRVKRALKDL